ncbi:MAG: hypothetical protein ABSB42_07835 [Tepidisphaeraceae bacterium]|jgi:hypothetical protein
MIETDLPTDIESCHALTRRLRDELRETRRKLAIHVENERREYEAHYGKRTSPQSLLAFGEMIASMDRSMSEDERRMLWRCFERT